MCFAYLGRWLAEASGDRAEAVRAVYAEWLSTTMPGLFRRDRGAAMVESLTRGGTEAGAMTAMAERMEREAAQWRRRVRRSRQMGRLEGRHEGRLEGRDEGRLEGRDEGRLEGRDEGREEGREEGLSYERALLQQQAARKFGTAAGEELARRLAGVTDPDRLAEIGGLIIDCDSGASLLARVDPP